MVRGGIINEVKKYLVKCPICSEYFIKTIIDNNIPNYYYCYKCTNPFILANSETFFKISEEIENENNR